MVYGTQYTLFSAQIFTADQVLVSPYTETKKN